MQPERFKLNAAVFLILRKGNKISLHRRFNTGFEDGKYDVISGHLDGGETCRETMVREAEEEAGITVNVEDLKLVYTQHNNMNKEYLNLYFEAEKWEGEPQNMEADKSDDMGWFDMNNLPELAATIKNALENISKGLNYGEYGWE